MQFMNIVKIKNCCMAVTCIAAWILAIGFFAGWTNSNAFLLTSITVILLGIVGYVWGEKRCSKY